LNGSIIAARRNIAQRKPAPAPEPSFNMK
jgi:hypothetical protein